MTKTAITRERLQEIAEDGFLKHGESKALAGMVLAAMGGDPVEWINGCNKSVPAALRYLAENPRPIGGESSFNTAHLYQLAREVELMAEAPLYRHAQPAPVVPNGLRLALSNAGIAAPESDEMLAATCEKHIQALVTWVRDRKPFQSAPVVMDDRKLRSLFDSWFASDCSFDLSPEASEEDNIAWRESYWYVWQRCRAAMLQAGNSPAHSGPRQEQSNCSPAQCSNSPAIPDGYRLQPISEYEAMCATVNSDEWPQRWIPVSERMPEDRTQVILWDAEIGEVTSGHYSHKTQTFYHCGDAIQNEITHWMLPPSAPQEVNHG